MPDPIAPQLSADDRGVWREDKPGQVFGIEWSEVYMVSGYKLDCVVQVDTVIELVFEFGSAIELNSTWDGFHTVIEAIKRNLSDLDPSQFDELEKLKPDDEPVTIWKRSSDASS